MSRGDKVKETVKKEKMNIFLASMREKTVCTFVKCVISLLLELVLVRLPLYLSDLSV